jgi:WD40 repeat protein
MSARTTLRPYKGLAAFDDEPFDALLFFGREREREIIVANLLASRLTVLYGPTGVGKSSLLRAGVAQRLRTFADSSVAIVSSWGEDPTEEIDEAIASSEGDTHLILDQIEEYFLYHDPDGAFAQRLPELVTEPGLRVNVLLGIREDSLAKLDLFKSRIPNLFANYVRLDHLDRVAARAAVVGPLERLNELAQAEEPYRAEPELVEAVLDQVATGRIEYGLSGRGVVPGQDDSGRVEAPFLQLVLERLWDVEQEGGSHTIRLETLERLGGAETIVRRHLERALEALAPEQRALVADMFEHLVTPSGTKIAHDVGDLARYARAGEDDVAGVLGHLVSERIIRPVGGRGGEQQNGRYEIFHDVLADGVLAWRSAFEAERELALERRRRRRAITVASVALLALAAVTAVALFALFQREHAQDAARRANARGLAAQANSLMDVDPARSVALAARAARLEPSPEVERQLREAVIGSRVRAVFRARGGAVTDATLSPAAGRVAVGSAGGWIRVFDAVTLRQLDEFRHPGRVTDIEFSRDGKLLVSAGSDGTARLWRAADGVLLHVFPHRGAVTSVSLSRDGRLLATGSRDRSGRVWDLSTGAQLRRLPLEKPVSVARFSPASDRVAFVSGTGVRLFDPLSGRLVRSVDQPGAIAAIDFSRNGQLIATAGADRIARIWRLDPPGLLHELRRHTGRVTDVAFSPHRVLLATGSTDATGLVWNVGRGTLRSNLLGHRGFVNSARFSTDGDFVITASRDKTARVWTAKSGIVESVLAGHRGAVVRANFSRDGTRALTWSDDGTVRLWDPGIRPELRQIARHDGPVTSVSFDAGGDAMLTAGLDGVARLRRGGRVVRTFSHGGPIVDAAISDDGRTVVTAGSDGLTRIWPLGGGETHVLRHGAPLEAVALHSGRVATAGRDGVVRVWSVPDGKLLHTLEHPAPVLDVAFDPTGRRIATAGADKIGRVWVDGRVVQQLVGHTDDVTSIAFGPRGGLLITASRDHSVRLWNPDNGAPVRTFEFHFAIVNEAAISSDGRWIVTAGPSRSGLWPVRGASVAVFLRGHQGLLQSATFAPGGHRIVTGGVDGTVRTYSCEECGRIPALLRLAELRLDQARER